MSRSRIISLCMGLCLVLVQQPSLLAQCDDDEFFDNCVALIGDFKYIRTYEATEIVGSTNYPYANAYIFSKGTKYVITACDKDIEGNRIVVNLYDRSRKLLATNYNKTTNKFFSKIIFECNATGVFFIQPLIGIDAGGCGISILGFMK